VAAFDRSDDEADSMSSEFDTHALTPFEAAVVAVIQATEPGDLMSYGEVAAEAGYPGAARAVGGVLKRVDGLPWWRVVTAGGRLIPHGAERQAALLRAEGVTVAGDRVVVAPSAGIPAQDSQS
jgi:methylated-DNA-protein-cysteine methyltransferase-like protein